MRLNLKDKRKTLNTLKTIQNLYFIIFILCDISLRII